MEFYPPTKVYRHCKENLKKCSLRGLESRADLQFYKYPNQVIPQLTDTIVLTLDAPLLTCEEKHFGLLLIDATWRYAQKMLRCVAKHSQVRYCSLPHQLRSAYPRRQTACPDPERGLASVEALYAAYRIMQRDTTGLLQHYLWKQEFLRLNYGL